MKINNSEQQPLFALDSLPIEINGVRAVNSVDLYDLVIPFDATPGQEIALKEFFKKGEYIIHSSGAYHWLYYNHVTKMRPGKLPNYFEQPVFPWIQSVYNKSGKIRVPGISQTKEPYPYVSLGEHSKKCYMHILAASAFLERPNNPEYCLVSHRNDMKWDYSLRNLFWNTVKNNSVGRVKTRVLNPLQIFDKIWDEYTHGKDYDAEEWNKEDDQF